MYTSAPMFTRYAKPSSHAFIAIHETGNPMSIEIMISRIKSFDNITITLLTDAPKTFRIPISFVRTSALKVASPNNPRHEMIIASAAKYFDITDTRCSEIYCDWYSSSRNLYSNKNPGLNFLYSSSILPMVSLSFPGAIFTMIGDVLEGSKLNTTGDIGSCSEEIWKSLSTPIIVLSSPHKLTFVPIGSFNPISFIAVSLKMSPWLSVPYALENDLPLISCMPSVSIKS